MDMSAIRLAHYLDHTCLRPQATPADVTALITEANQLGVWSVCVSPSILPLPVPTGNVQLVTVCGFPSGAHHGQIKAAEAAQAVALGAQEIDMVANLAFIKTGDRAGLVNEITAVRAEVSGILKVIIESAALSDEEIAFACQAIAEAGADFAKTSTGFHPAGGASVHAVEVMVATLPGFIEVKAAGGIRDYATAMAMIEAGATRIGASSSAAILAGAPTDLPRTGL